MASLNKVQIIGNLGKDCEMRYLPSGEAVATFSVATTEKWKDKGGNEQSRTDWHRIEFIGRLAEVCGEYLFKGDPVYIEGRMQYDQWEDKDGNKKTMAKVRGDRMQMLGGRRDGGGRDDDDRGGRDSGRPSGGRGDGGRSGGSDSNRDSRGGGRGNDSRDDRGGQGNGGNDRGGGVQSKPRHKLDDFDDDIPF